MNATIRPPPGFRGRFLQEVSDRNLVAEGAGILRRLPDAVAIPTGPADLAALVRWAAETSTSLVPRAAGTGMPGGNVGAGVVVDMQSGFRGIAEVDTERKCVRVEPGVTLSELNAICRPAGLHFPVDPSSGPRCALGGMLANNSAGAHSVKYGTTRDWTDALDVILADGSAVRVQRGEPNADPRLGAIVEGLKEQLAPHREFIRSAWPRVRKNSSGYALREYQESGDAIDLLLGSEGTLALIVGAELRLAPIPPRRGVAILEFTRLEAAGDAVQTLLDLGPATCEMLDRTFLELVRGAEVDAGYPLREGLEAILIVEMEGDTEEEVAERLEAVKSRVSSIASHVSIATDPEQQARFWQVRHAASPLIAARSDGRVSMQFIEDGVVPVERLAEYVRALRRTLAAHDTPAVIFGHAGDGNLHVNPLVDVSTPGWQHTIEEILYEIAATVADLGGTLSGEHGDGRLRAPLLEIIWGEEMVDLFRKVKQTFDPSGILNPGVILPLPGQRPLDALRDFPARQGTSPQLIPE